MAQKQKISKGKMRRAARNKARGKYTRQWGRTLSNKLRRVRKNCSSSNFQSESQRVKDAQEARQKK